MNQKKEKYTRLPGRSRSYMSLFDPSRYQLWLGADHLLHLSRTYFSESYKRFYFKDVQALVLTRTTAGRVVNTVLFIFILAFGLPAIILWISQIGPRGLIIFFALVTAFFLVLLGINALLGPTCRCQLNTAVQVEVLPSLGRLRSARRALAILTREIEAMQGTLTAEDLEATAEEQTIQQASAHAHQHGSSPSGEPEQIRHESGTTHTIFFALLVALALSSSIDIVAQHAIKNLFDMILGLTTMLFAIVSLVKQRNSDLPQQLKTTTWALLGVLILSNFVGAMIGAVYAGMHPEIFTPGSSYGMYDIRLEGPFFDTYFAIQAIIYAASGLIGLFQLRQFQSSYASSQPADPEDSISKEEHADE
jgi:hypothetical protein